MYLIKRMSLFEEISLNNAKLCCAACNKQYTRKSSLDKHKILCDFKIKTKRERQIDFEELGDIPNHLQLVKIVQQLSIKISYLEEELCEAKKWMNKKKKKINVIGWLNDNICPTIGFLEWVNMELKVKPSHFDLLMEYSLFHTIQKVFEDNLDTSKNTDFISPIRCFSEKQNIFYISPQNF